MIYKTNFNIQIIVEITRQSFLNTENWSYFLIWIEYSFTLSREVPKNKIKAAQLSNKDVIEINT